MPGLVRVHGRADRRPTGAGVTIPSPSRMRIITFFFYYPNNGFEKCVPESIFSIRKPKGNDPPRRHKPTPPDDRKNNNTTTFRGDIRPRNIQYENTLL